MGGKSNSLMSLKYSCIIFGANLASKLQKLQKNYIRERHQHQKRNKFNAIFALFGANLIHILVAKDS